MIPRGRGGNSPSLRTWHLANYLISLHPGSPIQADVLLVSDKRFGRQTIIWWKYLPKSAQWNKMRRLT